MAEIEAIVILLERKRQRHQHQRPTPYTFRPNQDLTQLPDHLLVDRFGMGARLSSGGGPLHLEVEAAVDGTVGSCWCLWLPSLLMVFQSTVSCSSVCGKVPKLSSRGGSGPM
ncbi:UNVERIFIED_CONTAM: hypothetical protein FKN15_035603 [Acipenser sinensis]